MSDESTRWFIPETSVGSRLTWDHPPRQRKCYAKGGIRVHVPPKVDYFQSPAGTHASDDAPYLWLNITGDFVA